MIFWLIVVSEFMVQIKSVKILKTYDWSCEIDGVVHCYRITSENSTMPKTGLERAQIEMMYHARNIAGDALIIWKPRGVQSPIVDARTKAAQAKTKRMF